MKRFFEYTLISIVASVLTYTVVIGKQAYSDYQGIENCRKDANVYYCKKEINYVAELRQ